MEREISKKTTYYLTNYETIRTKNYLYKSTKRFLFFYFFIFLFLSFSISSFSQEDVINQDVQVVREYNPIISDAFKVNDMPSATDTLKPAPIFRYQLKGKALIAPPEMVPMMPAKLAKEPLAELLPAYVRLYGGYNQILGGQLIYNLLRNKEYAFAFNIDHESSFGDIILEDNSKTDADYHQTNAGLYFRRFLANSTLSANMDFYNFAYRYYGFETIDPSITDYSKQRQTFFDMNVRLNNTVLNDDTKYDALLGFYSFENATGVSENSFRYKGDFDIPISEFILRLETSLNYAGLQTKNVEDNTDYHSRNNTLIQVNPSLLKEYDNFLIKLGVRIGVGFDNLNEKSKFYLSPDVGVN
jgi:hypothetical protein